VIVANVRKQWDPPITICFDALKIYKIVVFTDIVLPSPPPLPLESDLLHTGFSWGTSPQKLIVSEISKRNNGNKMSNMTNTIMIFMIEIKQTTLHMP
jgi:hypothetical protein